jgi:hypothetical protein
MSTSPSKLSTEVSTTAPQSLSSTTPTPTSSILTVVTTGSLPYRIRRTHVDDRIGVWSCHSTSIRGVCAQYYDAESIKVWSDPERKSIAKWDANVSNTKHQFHVVAERLQVAFMCRAKSYHISHGCH